MRQTGEIVKRYAGDTDAAKRQLGLARVLLGRMKGYLAGAHGSKLWRFSDGTVIETASVPSGDIVTIYAPPPNPVAAGHPHGFLFNHTDVEEQRYLFTVGDLFFNPRFRIKEDTEFDSGSLQWKGRRHNNVPGDDMLFYRGPESQYFFWKNYPPPAAVATDATVQIRKTIWNHHNQPLAGPAFGYVAGCARYSGEDGGGIVCAHTDGYEVRFSRYDGIAEAWVLLGSHTIAAAGTYVDYLSTIVPFTSNGRKCTFVTGFGGHYEVTLTYEDVTVTELAPPMERRAYYEYETNFVNNTTGTFGTVYTIENIYTLDSSGVGVMERTPGGVFTDIGLVDYDQILAADYNDQDELVWCYARVTDGGYFFGGSSVSGSYTPLFLTQDSENLSISIPATATGPVYTFETVTGYPFSNEGNYASYERDETDTANASVVSPLVGGKIELRFSDEDADPVTLAELVTLNYTQSFTSHMFYESVADPFPPLDHFYTEGTSNSSGGVTGSFEWRYRSIRFLDLKSTSAVISGKHEIKTVNATGSYAIEWQEGTRPAILDPENENYPNIILVNESSSSGTATHDIYAEDILYKNGEIDTTHVVLHQDYTLNIVGAGGPQGLAGAYIGGDASVRQSSSNLGRTGFAHAFGLDRAHAARMKLKKHNYFFSGLAVGDQMGTPPLNMLYLDGAFRVPFDLLGFDGLFVDIKVI